MIDTIPRPDATLPELLAARARHASDGRLALDALGGLLVALAAVFWRGPDWHFILSVAACFMAFGVWGIADRELGERAGSGSRALLGGLRAIRVVAGAIGVIAVISLLARFMAVALGRMIS